MLSNGISHELGEPYKEEAFEEAVQAILDLIDEYYVPKWGDDNE